MVFEISRDAWFFEEAGLVFFFVQPNNSICGVEFENYIAVFQSYDGFDFKGGGVFVCDL